MGTEEQQDMTAQQMTQWVDGHVSRKDGCLSNYAWRQVRKFECNVSALEPAMAMMVEAQTTNQGFDVLMYAISQLELSQRDRCILEWFAQDVGFSEMARRLQIERHTITKHLFRLPSVISRQEGPYAGLILCWLESVIRRHLFTVEGLD